MQKNLNFRFLLSFYIFIFIISIGSLNSQTFDLKEENFDSFKKTNNQFMITICNFADSICKNQRKLLEEASQKLKENFNLEFKFPFVDQEKASPKITSEFTFEEFVSSYFINVLEKERELYVGLREISSLMKYLEYKLIFPEDNLIEAKNEEDLNNIISKLTDKNPLILMGDIAQYKNINFRLLQQSARKAGIEKIIQIRNQDFMDNYFVNDYELALLDTENTEEKYYKISINKNKFYEKDQLTDLMKLAQFNIKKENIFAEFRNETLSLSLNYGIPTLNFFYSKKDTQLKEDLEGAIAIFANDYKSELIVSKGSINHQTIKELKIVKHYNITKNDLPMILFTKRPEIVFNSELKYGVSDFYDVEKYFLKHKDLISFVGTNMPDYMKSTNLSERDLEFSTEIIEKFYELCKSGNIEKEKVTSDLNRIEMNGHNFVEVVNESLNEENTKGVIILISPKTSKKYGRLRHRLERVFAKFYKANNETIIFDEFDPVNDEISFINVEFYPSIVIVQKKHERNKWKVTNFKGQLTTREISRFIKNTLEGNIFEQDLENEIEVNAFERDNRLYPLHKARYEGKFLSEFRVTQLLNIGLKRRWNNLRRLGLIEENSKYDNPNMFELDDLSNDFEINDFVDEGVLRAETANDENVSLENENNSKFEAKLDL
jgi:hypothetical protein